MTDLCTSDARFHNAKNSNYTDSFAAWARSYEMKWDAVKYLISAKFKKISNISWCFPERNGESLLGRSLFIRT